MSEFTTQALDTIAGFRPLQQEVIAEHIRRFIPVKECQLT